MSIPHDCALNNAFVVSVAMDNTVGSGPSVGWRGAELSIYSVLYVH